MSLAVLSRLHPPHTSVYLGEFNGHTYFTKMVTKNWRQDSKTQAEKCRGVFVCAKYKKKSMILLEQQINTSLCKINGFHIGIYQDLNRSDCSEPDGGWIGVRWQTCQHPNLEPFTMLENGQDMRY